MRQFDLVTGAQVPLVGMNTLNFVEVQGPRYKLVSQSAIFRLLLASFRWTSISGQMSMAIYGANLHVIMNRTGAASNKHLICPIKHGDPVLPEDGSVGVNFEFGGSQAFNFDVDGIDIRGDDLPDQHPIDIAPAGTNAFSIELKFEFEMLDGSFTGTDIVQPYYAVLADISDFSQALIRR